MNRKRYITVLVALLSITAFTVVPAAGAITTTASSTGPPAGMAGVPADQVGPPDEVDVELPDHVGPPSHAGPPDGSGPPTDAASWDVQASAHAGDLSMAIGETSDGQLALVLEDVENHDGREVAVRVDALEDALGYVPRLARGEHSSGETWTSEVRAEGDYAVVEVPHFSTNTVTFDGEVTIAADPAEDGSTFSYDLESVDAVEGFEVELTGVENEADQIHEYSHQRDGATDSVDVGGTTTAPVEVTMRAEPGDVRWEMDLENVAVGSVRVTAIDGSVVAVGSSTGEVALIDSSTDTVLWEASTGSDRVSDIDVTSEYVFATTQADDQRIIAFNRSDGTIEWDDERAYHVLSVDADPANNRVAAGVATENVAVVYDMDTGDELYTASASHYVRGVQLDGNQLLAADHDGVVRLYEDQGDTLVWESSAGTSARDAAMTDSEVYVSAGDYNPNEGEVVAFDRSDGSTHWNVSTFDHAALSIATDEEFVYTEARHSTYALDADTGDMTWTVSESTSGVAVDATESRLSVGTDGAVERWYAGPPPADPSVALDGSTTVSVDGPLEWETTATDTTTVNPGAVDLTTSISNGASVDIELEVSETTETVDPEIEINGHTAYHAGTLADGETTTLDVDESWITEGTNRVNVSVSESWDGPTGQVGLDYSHRAVDDQTVDYAAETWSERYDIGRTWSADQEDVSVTIPMKGSVIEVRELEIRRDGDEWTEASAADFGLVDDDLVIDLGSVDANETVEVRTVASKVRVHDGAITVTDPTVLGEELRSEIRIDERGEDFRIAVNASRPGDRLHYTHSESWNNPQSYARFDSNGDQTIHLPQAGAGETTRISTIPLEVEPVGGDAELRVTSSGSEPEIEVLEDTDADEIDLVWHDTTTGHVYQLYSLDRDTEIDRGEASSPVTLTHDGTAERLAIYDLGTGGTGEPAQAGVTPGETPTNPILLIVVAVGSLVVMFVVSRRFGDEDDGLSTGVWFAVGSLILGLLAVMALAPDILAMAIGAALEEALPLVLLIAAVVVVVWLRQRGDDQQITFDLGGERR